jgi:hypothetical protein
MFAYKIRRDEDYVIRTVHLTSERRGASVLSEHAVNIPSPARLLQERLVEEMAPALSSLRTGGLSPMARSAVIILAALACWLPLVGAATLVFG